VSGNEGSHLMTRASITFLGAIGYSFCQRSYSTRNAALSAFIGIRNYCFDAILRSELTEGAGTRRALQPSALSECRKINSRWGIPSTRAIVGAKLQSDLPIAIRNP
jgi:hypothetical protein